MVFLDHHLQKIATLKLYHMNGLWYKRVGNGTIQIDNKDKTLLICAANHHTDHNQHPQITQVPSEMDIDMDNNVIGIAIQDKNNKQVDTMNTSMINMYDIDCQYDLLIVVLYLLGYRNHVRLYSIFLFPCCLSF